MTESDLPPIDGEPWAHGGWGKGEDAPAGHERLGGIKNMRHFRDRDFTHDKSQELRDKWLDLQGL